MKKQTTETEGKTIFISNRNWKALKQIQLDANYKTMDEVISKLRGDHK